MKGATRPVPRSLPTSKLLILGRHRAAALVPQPRPGIERNKNNEINMIERNGPMLKLARALALISLLALVPAANAAAALAVEAAQARYRLAPHSSYLEDAPGVRTLEDVRAERAGWQPVQQEVPNFGYSQSAYWFKTRLHNPGSDQLRRLFEVGYPLLNHVDVYLIDDAGRLLRHIATGDRLPFQERPFAHRNFIVPLTLEGGQSLDLYLRVQTTSSAQIPLDLWQPSAFQTRSERELAAFALYAGIMLAMVAYNFFIFLSVRRRAYIYYVLFIASSGLLLLSLRGLPYEFLWPNAIWWQEHGIAILVFSVPVFGGLFSCSFLNLKTHSRLLVRCMRGIVAIGAAGMLTAPFLSYPVSIRLAVLTVMAWIVLVLVAGIYTLWRGEKAARFYLLAWGVFLGAAFMTSLYQFGVIPKTLVGEYTLLIGSALETLLLSFALADRINRMREQTVEAQQQALHNLQSYQNLYQEARYGLFTTEVNGRLIKSNPATASILGYGSVEEMKTLARDAREIYVDKSVRERMLAHLAEHGHVNGLESQLRRKDGGAVWVSISCRLEAGPGGERRLHGTLIDITERKERERAERARALAEKEREAATVAARAKSMFLSNMSHEIRTPLTAIIGYGEFLLEPRLDEPQRHELARTIVRSGRHLLELINEVLDLSKIEAGRLQIERVPVDLFAVIDEIGDAFAARARRKGLSFRIEHRFPLPRQIQTDPTRLRQILYNLCGNAVKFTETGSIALRVRWQSEGGWLQLAVIDTGIGIAPEQQARIFNAFAQTDVSTTRRYGGTGLGLSISRELAAMLGGEIRCESELGRGSRFDLNLHLGPLDASALVRERAPADGGEREDENILRLPRLRGRILYADDNLDSRKLVTLLVRGTGAEIETVESGEQAVALAAQREFDLVLLDIQMPAMDGFGALAQLRRQGFTKPVAALTANVMPEDRDNYAAAGFDACEAKPIERQAFYNLLERFLPPAAEATDADFLDALPAALKTLMQAVARGDWQQTAQLARKLKLADRSRGLAAAADALEAAAAARQPEAVLQALEALRRRIDQVLRPV
jgi:PAS domain S-box-containing protein